MVKQRAASDHPGVSGNRLDERRAAYARTGNHLWIAVACYHLSDNVARAMVDVELDLENLMAVDVGCFICEEPLRREMIGRRCPGEPRA